MEIRQVLEEGRTALGVELGSTRVKAVLVDGENRPIASGSVDWENRYENGIWTYSLDEIERSVRDCYARLAQDVLKRYGVTLKKIGAIGISAMMHGYMAFDGSGALLTPFRTWRNNGAARAAERLTEAFGRHIPARWSVAHLYQAILDREPHVRKIARLFTLAGYVHWRLTGRFVVGIGEASGMFPVDGAAGSYCERLLDAFDGLVEEERLPFRLRDLLPEVLAAGREAGRLTAAGARFLDRSGNLQAGVPFAPPEGDAGTGMVATNSLRPRTGNVSAGTSVFAMIVLDQPLKGVHAEIDGVVTPVGDEVAMVHCNNCTSDLNAWVEMFAEFARLTGSEQKKAELYDLLYFEAEKGDRDCGGLLAYNCVSNEHVTEIEAGRPLFARTPQSTFTLANFMRAHLYSALGALKIGCDILFKEEGVKLDAVTGHGGLFKTERVGQRFLAAALGAPVTVLKTAGEGGAWGMATLANYVLTDGTEALADYLDRTAFSDCERSTLSPDPKDEIGFDAFMRRYIRGLPVVRQAVVSMREEGEY